MHFPAAKKKIKAADSEKGTVCFHLRLHLLVLNWKILL